MLNLTTLDTVIYNTTRLYRISNTKNPKSGLYKIELEPADLEECSVEQIKQSHILIIFAIRSKVF